MSKVVSAAKRPVGVVSACDRYFRVMCFVRICMLSLVPVTLVIQLGDGVGRIAGECRELTIWAIHGARNRSSCGVVCLLASFQ